MCKLDVCDCLWHSENWNNKSCNPSSPGCFPSSYSAYISSFLRTLLFWDLSIGLVVVFFIIQVLSDFCQSLIHRFYNSHGLFAKSNTPTTKAVLKWYWTDGLQFLHCNVDNCLPRCLPLWQIDLTWFIFHFQCIIHKRTAKKVVLFTDEYKFDASIVTTSVYMPRFGHLPQWNPGKQSPSWIIYVSCQSLLYEAITRNLFTSGFNLTFDIYCYDILYWHTYTDILQFYIVNLQVVESSVRDRLITSFGNGHQIQY